MTLIVPDAGITKFINKDEITTKNITTGTGEKRSKRRRRGVPGVLGEEGETVSIRLHIITVL